MQCYYSVQQLETQESITESRAYNCTGSQLHLKKEKLLVTCISLTKLQSSYNYEIRLLPQPNTSYSILTVIFTAKI